MGDNYALFLFVSAVDILLCAAIIFFNLLLFLVIVCSKAARARTRNALLVSMCLADLLVGAFTHPVYIHSYMTGTFLRSCEFHLLLQLIGDYSQDFVCFWTLVTVGGLYVYRLVKHRWGWGWRTSLPGHYSRLTSARRPACVRCCHIVIRILLIAWPWLAVFAIPIPILLFSVDPHKRDIFWDETFCPLHITFPARIAVLVLVFYLPMAALLMLVVGIGLASCSWSNRRNRPSSPAAVESRAEGGALYSAENGGVSSEGVAFTTASSQGLEHPQMINAIEPHGSDFDTENTDSNTHAEPTSLRGLAEGFGDGRDALDSEQGMADNAELLARTGRPRTVSADFPEHDQNTDGLRSSTGPVSASEGDSSLDPDSDLEQPFHIVVPLLVTLICALPLMIGWWFYARMSPDQVIVVAVTLHRLYLLRAALLPASWFLLPDLHQPLASLLRKACSCCRRCRRRGDGDGFSVAYSTLRETRDASASTQEASANTATPERRHNPFNESEPA